MAMTLSSFTEFHHYLAHRAEELTALLKSFGAKKEDICLDGDFWPRRLKGGTSPYVYVEITEFRHPPFNGTYRLTKDTRLSAILVFLRDCELHEGKIDKILSPAQGESTSLKLFLKSNLAQKGWNFLSKSAVDFEEIEPAAYAKRASRNPLPTPETAPAPTRRRLSAEAPVVRRRSAAPEASAPVRLKEAWLTHGSLDEVLRSFLPHYPNAHQLLEYHHWLKAAYETESEPLIVRNFSHARTRGDQWCFAKDSGYGDRRGELVRDFHGARDFFITDMEALSSAYWITLTDRKFLPGILANIDFDRVDLEKIWLHGNGRKVYPNPIRNTHNLKLAHVFHASQKLELPVNRFGEEIRLRAYRSMHLLNVFPFPNSEFFHVEVTPRPFGPDASESEPVRKAMLACIYFEVMGALEPAVRIALWKDLETLLAPDFDISPEALEEYRRIARRTQVAVNLRPDLVDYAPYL